MSAAKNAAEKLLVTGGSGYVASHVIKLLQEAGYLVRATLRGGRQEDKIRQLNMLCPVADHHLEVVEADLNRPESWNEAVHGVKYVLHVASPWSLLADRTKEHDVIRPALDGTLGVLKACANSGTVRRVVLTGSCVSVDWSQLSHNLPRDESLWANLTINQHPCFKSKILAERAAWNFMRELPGDQKFELAVINPSFILGPPLLKTSSVNVQAMRQLLQSRIPVLPDVNLPLVDVRDVAEAHVRAMTVPEAAGHRHLVTGRNMWLSELTALLKDVFGPQGYKLPRVVGSPALLKVAGLISDRTRNAIPYTDGLVHLFDNTRMRQVLGLEAREVSDSAIEMVYAMIETGNLEETERYKGPEDREVYRQLKH